MSLRPDSLLHVQRATRLTFNHLCTIQRDVNDDATGWGDGEDFQPLHVALPCEFWVDSDVEQVEPGVARVVDVERLVVPYGTDVKTGDKVTLIEDLFGVVVSDREHDILGVVPRLDEFELQLRSVGGTVDEE